MTDPDPDDRFPLSGPALDIDGRLVNRLERVEPTPTFGATDEPIELAERQPKPAEAPVTEFREAYVPRARRFGVRLALVAVVLAAGLFAAAVVLRPDLAKFDQLATVKSNSLVDSVLTGGPHATLTVTSTPPGATVTIGGQQVGVTPWAGDNVWGSAEVVVELPGYKRWSRTLVAGEDATLSATLKR